MTTSAQPPDTPDIDLGFSPSWWPRISIMDRYIAKELLLPFLFGVGAFSSIGVSVGALFDLIREVTESGLQVSLAMQIFVLRMPEFIVLAFPMSTLLATMMTYSRFSADSEMIALRGCGISVRRIIAPAVALSIFVTGVTFVFNEVITPAANYRAEIILDRALESGRLPFRDRNILYNEYQDAADDANSKELGRLFYARRFNGTEMQGLTILDFSQTGLDQIVSADSATWDLKRNTWNFKNGTIYAISPDGSFGHIVKFEEQELKLPRAPLDLASNSKDDDEMNIGEATEHLKLLRQSGDDRKARLWELRIQQKYSIPIVCVVFGIVGSSIGVRPRRTGRATSFGVSVIIIFGYYIFSFIADAMGKVGVLSPFMAAWLPPIIGLAIGIGLVIKASK
ncbi:MAG: LptF/LptG family permease [Cyanobacteria bacterium P01_A01_bin.114]